MKNFFVLTFLLICPALSAQVSYTKLAELKYSDLPIRVRIENSGIYGISSFDIVNNEIRLYSFDYPELYIIKDNRFTERITYNSDMMPANTSSSLYKSDSYSAPEQKNIFLKGKESLYSDSEGLLKHTSGDSIRINVKNRSRLNIEFNISDFNKSIELKFPDNLAYSDLIGIDSYGNSLLIAETYLSEIPLKVKREVYTVSSEGRVLSVLEIPSGKYMFLRNEFRIDAEGNLYHLLTSENKLTVIKWTGLTTPSAQHILYPDEYYQQKHYNLLVPSAEPLSDDSESTAATPQKIQAADRFQALRTAESYVLHRYTCTAKNLAPTNVLAADQDYVKTPSWLVEGVNARIPYKWGGFNTLAQFTAGMANGKFAGDINTEGVSSYAVGVDCSGFVSRCWQLTYHSSTAAMPNISTQLASWDSLKPGDAIHKVGHVRLYVDKASNGALRVAEAAGRNWDVSYYTFAPSDLTAYTPRCYTGMQTNYHANLIQPTIISVTKHSEGMAKIKWACSTKNIKGFRLYRSADGTTWKQIQNETTLTGDSALVAMNSNSEYYRVSSVKNDSAYYSESSLSNAMGISKYSGTKKALIVYGLDNDLGGWRGKGNTFVTLYGKALDALKINFESLKSYQVANSNFNLNDYSYIYWMAGDESSVTESFSAAEQTPIKAYLENGGCLFVSGSEIGWDLSAKGNVTDKSFYNNYLKASFLSDNAGSNLASGKDSSAMSGLNIRFGQTYVVSYPDVISAYGGSTSCMLYSTNTTAGVQYTGAFGTSAKQGKLIYLAFPLETTANDTSFNTAIKYAHEYFTSSSSPVEPDILLPVKYSLSQNYPNPFNPSTLIRYQLPEAAFVSLKVYDILGREVATLVNEFQNAGAHSSIFSVKNSELRTHNSELSSGMYMYRIQTKNYTETKKMLLVK